MACGQPFGYGFVVVFQRVVVKRLLVLLD